MLYQRVENAGQGTQSGYSITPKHDNTSGNRRGEDGGNSKEHTKYKSRMCEDCIGGHTLSLPLFEPPEPLNYEAEAEH